MKNFKAVIVIIFFLLNILLLNGCFNQEDKNGKFFLPVSHGSWWKYDVTSTDGNSELIIYILSSTYLSNNSVVSLWKIKGSASMMSFLFSDTLEYIYISIAVYGKKLLFTKKYFLVSHTSNSRRE